MCLQKYSLKKLCGEFAQRGNDRLVSCDILEDCGFTIGRILADLKLQGSDFAPHSLNRVPNQSFFDI